VGFDEEPPGSKSWGFTTFAAAREPSKQFLSQSPEAPCRHRAAMNESPAMKAIGVLTSGGDSPGMNPCLRAVVKTAAAKGVTVWGSLEGYEGLIDGRFRELTQATPDGVLSVDREVDFAGSMGGTLLGSARSARFRDAAGRAQAVANLKARGIDGLVVLGGNGSLTGAHLLAKEHGVRVMGVPASIDNDIGGTATCLGVDSALNTIVHACDNISDTARAHRRAFVVEVMGRQCGYLAMASAIAVAADAALIREGGKTEQALVEQVANVVRQGFSRGKRRVLIIKAEGVEIPTTKLVRLVEEKIAAEHSTAEIRATVLGHVVRGGNPSYMDRMVAGRFGLFAVTALLEGATDEMVAWQPPVQGGLPTQDSSVQRFPLDRVLTETDALIDGSSPVTKRRLQLMEKAAGVLQI
jgi:6-phosphofructokinase 1